MNIKQDIMEYAEELGLESMATGGGLDYITLSSDYPRIDLVLGAKDDAGSPESLDSAANVTLYICPQKSDYEGDDFWRTENQMTKDFITAREAMNYMAKFRSTNNLKIILYRGVVDDVHNLPDGWTYEVIED